MLLINEHHWIVNGASNFITFRAHMYHLIKFDYFSSYDM